MDPQTPVEAVLCAFPVRVYGTAPGAGVEVRCGRCMPCRALRREAWALRILLEISCHPATSWVTLTYSDAAMPRVDVRGTLYPKHFTRYIRRVRKDLGPTRYFGVGEYGPKSWRPHYHVMLFGQPAEAVEEHALRYWGERYGFVSVDCASQHTSKRAAYVAGYCLKKLTNPSEMRLDGRHPEFMRQSLKPAIGLKAVASIAEAMTRRGTSQVIAETGDVPRLARLGGKVYPMDATLRNHIRRYLGVPLRAAERLSSVVERPKPTLESRLKAKDVHEKMRHRLGEKAQI